jgi:hypothetical protein
MEAHLERKKNEAFAKQVVRADGENKRWTNRIKYIVFIFLALGTFVALLGLLGKFVAGPVLVRPPVSARPATDSEASGSSRDQAATSRTEQKTPSAASNLPTVTAPATSTVPANSTASATSTASAPVPASVPVRPLQSTVSDNIEFKLLKAEGNAMTQSITMTMVLTTSAANWYIMSSVKTIIDNDGNEYKLKSFMIGSNNYFPKVELTTGVPMRCVYTFGGVLPGVRFVKLFKYGYTHQWGQPFAVEFRDIPVDWR